MKFTRSARAWTTAIMMIAGLLLSMLPFVLRGNYSPVLTACGIALLLVGIAGIWGRQRAKASLGILAKQRPGDLIFRVYPLPQHSPAVRRAAVALGTPVPGMTGNWANTTNACTANRTSLCLWRGAAKLMLEVSSNRVTALHVGLAPNEVRAWPQFTLLIDGQHLLPISPQLREDEDPQALARHLAQAIGLPPGQLLFA